ncbi:MAG: glycosyltransferase family 4 protein [Eubacteriales bacterium]
MRILVFTQYFYPERFRVNILCKELKARGHDVTVVTGYPQYPQGKIYEGYGFNIPYETEWDGIRIVRLPVHARGHNLFGMLRNCLDYVLFGNRWVKNCSDKFDVIYVFEVSPVTVGLPAVTYKRKFGTPIFFNVQDLWPENVEVVLGIRFKPIIWVINKIVDYIYNNSDRILCSSRGFVKNIATRGIDQDKLVYWPQFCNDFDFSGCEKPIEYSEDTFNIVFAGNIGDAQGLDLLVDVAEELKNQNIRWYIVGDGRAKLRLQERVNSLGIADKVLFLGQMSEQVSNRYVFFADAAYLSFQDNPLFNMTIPAKLQTYLMCGTPVLAVAGGESAEIIQGNNCGLVSCYDVNTLCEAVRKMSAFSNDELAKIRRNCRLYYIENFNKDSLVEELITLMHTILKSKK